MATVRAIAPEETIPLRQTVLYPDRPVEDILLPDDASGMSFGAFLPNIDQPVAVIFLFTQDQAGVSPNSLPAVRIRHFACAPEYQGQGIGRALLEFACSYSREQLNAQIVWCDARMPTVPWYERRGMTTYGEIFQKSGIDHIRMQIQL